MSNGWFAQEVTLSRGLKIAVIIYIGGNCAVNRGFAGNSLRSSPNNPPKKIGNV
jgi:uncharacterized protein YneR